MQNRFLKLHDVEQITNLYQKAFNDILPAYFFKWKYFTNPNGDAIVLGMFVNDELVGSGALIPEYHIINSKLFTIFKFTDLMTSPDHQKKGISSIIMYHSKRVY